MDIMKIMVEPNGVLPQRTQAENLCELLKKNREACAPEDLDKGGKYHSAYVKKINEAKEALKDVAQYECVNVYQPNKEEGEAIMEIINSPVGKTFWKALFKAYFSYNDMSLVDMILTDMKNRICYRLGEIYAKNHGNPYTWANPWNEAWGKQS